MSAAEEDWGELGDLMEGLVEVAADLIVAVRDEGPDAIRGCLLRVPRETAEGLEHMPGGAMGALAVVLAAMVNPETPLRSALNWTEAMRDPRRVRRNGAVPPAERERQRLVAAGVPDDTALVLAAREATHRQDRTSRRRLHSVA